MPNNYHLAINKKGMAIILALFLVTITTSLSAYIIHKQNLIITRVKQQKSMQNLQGLSIGALSWAKIALSSDNNDVDYRGENVWKTNHLNISELLHDKQENVNDEENIYLSAYMEDAQSKFNINSIAQWQIGGSSDILGSRYPVNINEKYFFAYENLLKNLNIDSKLAWQTLYYIFSSYNITKPKITLSLDNSSIQAPQSNIKIKGGVIIRYPYDLLEIGYTYEDIQKLIPYITFLDYDTKINANTANPIILKSLIPSIGKPDFFKNNPNIYANNLSDIVNYLQISYTDTKSINTAQNCLDTKTQFMDIYGKLEQGNYSKKIFARINKTSKSIEEYLEGSSANKVYIK
jgi:type II secretory pathway component PulK